MKYKMNEPDQEKAMKMIKEVVQPLDEFPELQSKVVIRLCKLIFDNLEFRKE